MIPTWISTSFTAEGWDCFAGKPHVTGLILRSVPIMIFLFFFGCANLFSKQDIEEVAREQSEQIQWYSLLWRNLLKTAFVPNKSCCSFIFFSHAVVQWFCVLDTGGLWRCNLSMCAFEGCVWSCCLLQILLWSSGECGLKDTSTNTDLPRGRGCTSQTGKHAKKNKPTSKQAN